MSDDHFLSRWSRRKHAANRGEVVDNPAIPQPAPNAGSHREGKADVAPAQDVAPAEGEVLPPVESLTPESDFSPFMRPGVDPATKQAALKTLFSDPRFNVMDGLDVYIDDYSKPDPIPAEWMGRLSQLARLGDFRAQEAETAEEGENDAAATQIARKPEEQQSVGEAKVDESSHTANKDVTPPEVGQS